MIENNTKNREILASQAVDNMDLKDLISCMVDQISEDYKNDDCFYDGIEAYDLKEEDFE